MKKRKNGGKNSKNKYKYSKKIYQNFNKEQKINYRIHKKNNSNVIVKNN